MNDHDHIDTLKAAADPLRVAAALGLQGRGSRFFCPVCQPSGGKTPDLSVRDKGFVCHKCGLKGDILKLIEVALDMTFPAAVAWLEGETGIRRHGHHAKGTGRDKGRGEIVQPGASCEAVGGFSVKTTGPGADSAIYEVFLEACRPVEGRALDFLTKDKGVKPEVVIALGLRFCGREYLDIITTLKERFGESALLVAGLLKRNNKGRLVPSFFHYYAKKAGFLVIPYLKDGRPVYLKARPPVSKEDAERLGLVRFMNTAAAVPCLYNLDALTDKTATIADLQPDKITHSVNLQEAYKQPERVLICEGESDTWTALSYGFAAVGSPGAKGFKEAWIEDFQGIEDADGRSKVFLVLDADKAGDEGALTIANLFLKAGFSVPLRITLPPGTDLTEYMKEGITE